MQVFNVLHFFFISLHFSIRNILNSLVTNLKIPARYSKNFLQNFVDAHGMFVNPITLNTITYNVQVGSMIRYLRYVFARHDVQTRNGHILTACEPHAPFLQGTLNCQNIFSFIPYHHGHGRDVVVRCVLCALMLLNVRRCGRVVAFGS